MKRTPGINRWARVGGIHLRAMARETSGSVTLKEICDEIFSYLFYTNIFSWRNIGAAPLSDCVKRTLIAAQQYMRMSSDATPGRERSQLGRAPSFIPRIDSRFSSNIWLETISTAWSPQS